MLQPINVEEVKERTNNVIAREETSHNIANANDHIGTHLHLAEKSESVLSEIGPGYSSLALKKTLGVLLSFSFAFESS